MAFTGPIFTKLTFTRRFVYVPCPEVYPSWAKSVEITGKISFTLQGKLCLSLDRISPKSVKPAFKLEVVHVSIGYRGGKHIAPDESSENIVQSVVFRDLKRADSFAVLPAYRQYRM